MTSRRLQISVSNGSITLEGALFSPPSPPASKQSAKVAVLCHPWSWLGGSMNDYVLHLLTPVLTRRGYRVIRFNSRGVGTSTGRATFRGDREVEDLREVVRWGIEQSGGKERVERVLLVGYSHGSLITSRHPPLPDIPTSHLLISYPISVRAFLTFFAHSTYRNALLSLAQDPRGDILAVYGDSDNFSGEAALDAWAKELERAASQAKAEGRGGGQVRTVKVEGANHFWSGEAGERLVDIVEEWLEER